MPNETVAVLGSVFDRYVYSFDLPALNSKTIEVGNYLGVRLSLPAAGLWTIDLSRIQLEIGGEATLFEHRHRAEELLLCQRYFLRLGESDFLSGGAASATEVRVVWNFPVEMRAEPTITRSGLEIMDGACTVAGAVGSVTIINATTKSARLNASSTTDIGTLKNDAAFLRGAGASDYIQADAEF